MSVAHGDDLATYAAQGLLLKSDGIVKTLGYGANDFPSGVFDAGNYKGAQYAIPWSVTPLGLYVNNAVLKKAGIDPAAIPTDKAAYLKALDALKAAGMQGEWVDGYVFTGTFEFESLIWQMGGQLYNKDVTAGDLQLRRRRAGPDLDDRPGQEGPQPGERRPGRQLQRPHQPARPPSTGTASGRPPTTALPKVEWTAAPVPQIGTQKARLVELDRLGLPGQQGRGQEQDGRGGDVREVDERPLAGWAGTGELPADNTVRNNPIAASRHTRT